MKFKLLIFSLFSLCLSCKSVAQNYTAIPEIQGQTHISPYLNQEVTTKGIVTEINQNGFYLQNPLSDNNQLTSEGIFVFTKSKSKINIGDEVIVEGKVTEYTPKENNLSVTTLNLNSLSILSKNNPLPPAIIIGEKGYKPPTEIIDNDNLTIFDPTEDGIDFYESLEGMRVTIKDTMAISPLNKYGEIFTVTDKGRKTDNLSSRQTLVIGEKDFNPERIQLQLDKELLKEIPSNIKVGDYLGNITGIMSYNFGNYEVYISQPFTVKSSKLVPQVTSLHPQKNQLTIASYNVHNLDTNDNDGDKDIEKGQFKTIASQIVNNLKSPDIIALQEIQDNSGSEDNGIVEANLTYQTLIKEISQLAKINYQFIDIPPNNNEDGGEPGANIRVGYLYNPNRVELINNSVTKIDDIAFKDTRKPLVTKFKFQGQEITLINNHFSSKGGSSSLFGISQPPLNGQENERLMQAKVVNNYIQTLVNDNQNSQVIVLGDFNDFEFNNPLKVLKGNLLVNLTETIKPNQRYTYIYEGNAQTIDHIFVTKNLENQVKYEQIHINTEFTNSPSDHDPVIVKINL